MQKCSITVMENSWFPLAFLGLQAGCRHEHLRRHELKGACLRGDHPRLRLGSYPRRSQAAAPTRQTPLLPLMGRLPLCTQPPQQNPIQNQVRTRTVRVGWI